MITYTSTCYLGSICTIYICIYIYIYIYIHIDDNLHINFLPRNHMHYIYIYICTYIYLYIYAYAQAHLLRTSAHSWRSLVWGYWPIDTPLRWELWSVYVCMHVCMCIYMCARTNTQDHKHARRMQTNTRMHT